jgi:soluble lytic murein transglycosylase-like protein
VAALCAVAGAARAAGAIYLTTTTTGLPDYSSEPPSAHSQPFLVLGKPSPRPRQPRLHSALLSPRTSAGGAYDRLRERSIQTLVAAAARAYDLPHALLLAVMHAESNFVVEARSPMGAIGLMQIMPPTGARYGVRRGLAEPMVNIDVGARYLKDLLRLFDGDTELALAAYNAGEGAVLKHGRRIPPYEETRAYVPKVMRLYADYAGRGAAD